MTEELKIEIAKAINGPFLMAPDSSRYTLEDLRNVRWSKHGGAQRRHLLNQATSVLELLSGYGVDIDALARKVAGDE